MPAIQHVTFGSGRIYIGDGAVPVETFTKTCGFNSISAAYTTESGETVTWDCDTPDKAAYVIRDAISRSLALSCSGVADKSTWARVRAAFNTGAAVNCRLIVAGAGEGAGTPDLQFAGPFILNYTLSGERGSRYQLEVELTSAGEIVETNVAAS